MTSADRQDWDLIIQPQRSLLDLLPQVERSTCFYGCLPEDIEIGGIEAVCPDCAKKYGEGQPLKDGKRSGKRGKRGNGGSLVHISMIIE